MSNLKPNEIQAIPGTPTATILVVDDTEDNRVVLSRRLAPRGLKPIEALSGAMAIRILDTQPVDLVLLDIMMPNVSGLDVLSHIRARFVSPELPVIMMSARDDMAALVQTISAGANDYIVKPFQFNVVLARIAAQLRIKAAYDAAIREVDDLRRQLAVARGVVQSAA